MGNETFEVAALTGLAYGGEAIGRLPDGRAVFVPYALPGERVRVRPVDERPRFVRAALVDVLQASPRRIAPRCPHFTTCGGCHYQHLSSQDQLLAKADILRDQLMRIGHLADPPLQPAVASPLAWNYRNHVQFHLDRNGRLGFQASGSHAVIPVRECHLPEAALGQVWPALEFDPDLGLERVGLRLGADGDVMLVLESEHGDLPEVVIEAGLSVVHLAGGHAVVLAGNEHLSIEVSAAGRPVPFRVSAASFFQVNTAMAGMMVAHVLDLLPEPVDVLLDVYCGVGLFSRFLAERCQRLLAVEADPAAWDDFGVNLGAYDHVELYEGPAEAVLPLLDATPQAVVVDPPRAGLERAALDALVRMGPPRIVYVSCDPSTLARDAARLAAGNYRLVQVTPFDLFPQTCHIESISLFERT